MMSNIEILDKLEHILVSDEILIKYEDLKRRNIQCEIVASTEAGHMRLDLDEYLLYRENILFNFDIYGSDYQPIKV